LAGSVADIADVAHPALRASSALLRMLLLQPAILFVGERFDSDQDFKLAKSMLLDMFRGQQVSQRLWCTFLLLTGDASSCSGCVLSLMLLLHAAGHVEGAAGAAVFAVLC
jgi:hypothetical protein